MTPILAVLHSYEMRMQLFMQFLRAYSCNRKLLFTEKTELIFIIGIVSYFPCVHVPNFCDKVRAFQQRFCVRPKDFVATWFPGLPLISHPAFFTYYLLKVQKV